MTSIKYPATGALYQHEFDSMGRPPKLREGTTEWARNAVYNAASLVTGLDYRVGAGVDVHETRFYNARYQLTRRDCLNESGFYSSLSVCHHPLNKSCSVTLLFSR